MQNHWMIISIFLFIMFCGAVCFLDQRIRENQELREILNIKRRREIKIIKECIFK